MEWNKLRFYFTQKSLTDKGRNYIAAYQRFTREWNNIKKRHDDVTATPFVMVDCTLKWDPKTEFISHE